MQLIIPFRDKKVAKTMNENLTDIFDSIRDSGFLAHALQLIGNYTNDILNGRTNIHRFNLQEHAGLCTAGAPLIGRTPSVATREQALNQVAFLLKAKQAAQVTGK